MQVTTISAGIDYGQPYRRIAIGDNVTYTDWHKNNFFYAVAQELKDVRGKVSAIAQRPRAARVSCGCGCAVAGRLRGGPHPGGKVPVAVGVCVGRPGRCVGGVHADAHGEVGGGDSTYPCSRENRELGRLGGV